ncbi:hypothetical protein Sjap_018194 [Stephania japonica]|uniref:Cysteine protease n=1 Tax=Stephania japonica TaxID=461633 RepID=A0AAP0I7K4_9MAGN
MVENSQCSKLIASSAVNATAGLETTTISLHQGTLITNADFLQLDSVDTSTVAIYGSTSLFALWIASFVVGAIDAIPLTDVKSQDILWISALAWEGDNFAIYGSTSLFAIWIASAVVGAIDAIPLMNFAEDVLSFDVIGDSKYSSDVNWGCMLRSSQMLVAQALLFHCLGRSWRRPLEKPFDKKYVDILHLFGDSQSLASSIHHLLQAGKQYGKHYVFSCHLTNREF